MPAKAGIQYFQWVMDAAFAGMTLVQGFLNNHSSPETYLSSPETYLSSPDAACHHILLAYRILMIHHSGKILDK